MTLNKEQEGLVERAGALIKQAFPYANMRFSFNLCKNHDNVNYNMEGDWKISGIINPKPKK